MFVVALLTWRIIRKKGTQVNSAWGISMVKTSLFPSQWVLPWHMVKYRVTALNIVGPKVRTFTLKFNVSPINVSFGGGSRWMQIGSPRLKKISASMFWSARIYSVLNPIIFLSAMNKYLWDNKSGKSDLRPPLIIYVTQGLGEIIGNRKSHIIIIDLFSLGPFPVY